MFTGIVFYHCYQQLKSTSWGWKLVPFYRIPERKLEADKSASEVHKDVEDSTELSTSTPTMTVVDVCELHSYELREPCMETY